MFETNSILLYKAETVHQLYYYTVFLYTNTHRCGWVTDILWLAPYFVLFEKKRKQHQHASIMHNPPDVNVAFIVTLVVAGVERHILGNQQSQMSCSCAANSTCQNGEEQTVTSSSARVSYGLKQQQNSLRENVSKPYKSLFALRKVHTAKLG